MQILGAFMQTNYSYPLEPDWTPTEVVQVMKLYNLVEQAYEFGAKVADLQAAYRDFKVVVQSKMQEKQIDKAFSEASGYSIYRCMQATKKSSRTQIKMTLN
ncbi:UPF0223 family protein [Latilactobacillus curvatus]|nr:UPF0223 family protein [Latilactobacillus curvatus]MCP8848115.1 UPF0223 family protein [Latilactobacillus curvatus]MCP8849857.1 UPF0223 family protein [Latilactobacillus curvatus]MCP8864740.1 UPF0223 family protein [Latilactobacillus curvatus]MCP8873615.1 UPF0223 family protein [Latilactobacillus curvatus]MCP8875420.1 UPF0223 family protein [Latilactobacillus curvatus]